MSIDTYQARGVHLLADFHGVAPDLLSDANVIESLLLQSARAAGAHILSSHFHAFGPQRGVTGVALLAESHISIHTWPEYGFAAADIFMCGGAAPQRALEMLQRALQATSCSVQSFRRGQALERDSAPAAYLAE